MMGEEDYLDNALTKIRRYCRNNIYPDGNLILTYESRQTPLDSELVLHIIEHYFS